LYLLCYEETIRHINSMNILLLLCRVVACQMPLIRIWYQRKINKNCNYCNMYLSIICCWALFYNYIVTPFWNLWLVGDLYQIIPLTVYFDKHLSSSYWQCECSDQKQKRYSLFDSKGFRRFFHKVFKMIIIMITYLRY